MNKIRLALGVIIAFMLCLTVSCNKEKEKTTGQIQGIVSDANTFAPIQGVSITINPSGMSAITSSDGSYEFIDLGSGSHGGGRKGDR